jgi:hypothetical protein
MIRVLKEWWRMAIDPHTSPQNPERPAGPGYETRDVNVPVLMKFALWLAVAILLAALVSRWVFGYFAHTQSLGPATTPFENVRTLPPLPRLQTAPQKDIHDYWQSQQDELNGYGWVDRSNGVVRIPVDRAMQLLLQRGLPARAAAPAPDTSHSTLPVDNGKAAGGTEE